MRTRLLSLWFTLPAFALAEEVSGTLHGRDGAVISGARVLLMSEDYVKLAETKSGERGEFAFRDLQPALYLVQAKKSMFQITQRHVFLKAGQAERIYLVASVARGEDRFTSVVDRLVDTGPAPRAGRRASGKPEPFKRLSGRPPAMPDSLRARGVRGVVALYATIQTDGSLADMVTLDSPDAELEQVCRDSLRQWRYAPMKLDGVAVESDTLVIFEFKPGDARL